MIHIIDFVLIAWPQWWSFKARFLPKYNEMSSNRSSLLKYLPLFWPVRQSRAAVEPNLSLSQNTLISWYTYQHKKSDILLTFTSVKGLFIIDLNKFNPYLGYLNPLWIPCDYFYLGAVMGGLTYTPYSSLLDFWNL